MKEEKQRTPEATPFDNGLQGLDLTTSKTIWIEWGGFPGRRLGFPLGMAMSSEMTRERARFIGLKEDERQEVTTEFSIKIIADLLEGDPISEQLIFEKNEKGEILKDEKGQPRYRVIGEPLPGYPPGNAEDRAERFIEYFSRKDSRDRYIFQRLIEEIVNLYWDWALPRPIFSGSGF